MAAETEAAAVSLAGHPRAVRGVARTKSWGALAGFLLGGYLSLLTHTVAEAGLRALAAGAFCYLATWAAAVFLWRRLVVVELRSAERELLAAELAKLGEPEGRGIPPTPSSQRGRAQSAS